MRKSVSQPSTSSESDEDIDSGKISERIRSLIAPPPDRLSWWPALSRQMACSPNRPPGRSHDAARPKKAR